MKNYRGPFLNVEAAPNLIISNVPSTSRDFRMGLLQAYNRLGTSEEVVSDGSGRVNSIYSELNKHPVLNSLSGLPSFLVDVLNKPSYLNSLLTKTGQLLLVMYEPFGSCEEVLGAIGNTSGTYGIDPKTGRTMQILPIDKDGLLINNGDSSIISPDRSGAYLLGRVALKILGL